MRLYEDLAHTYTLLTPRQDYQEEAAIYERLIREVVGSGRISLLELGAGAGHNASWFGNMELTLTDPAQAMLALAAGNLPSARLVQSDMRSLRLGSTFDAVFAHDAVAYLLERADLDALAATCWIHLRPGGVALVAPDEVSETFEPGTNSGGSDGEGESVRYLEWSWQPDGQPERTVVDYVVVHRRGDEPAQVHVDRHHHGLFPAAVWRAAFERQGFIVEQLDEGIGNVLFRAVRPPA